MTSRHDIVGEESCAFVVCRVP